MYPIYIFKLYIIGVLIYISLMMNEVEHFFIFLLVICVSLWNTFIFHILIFCCIFFYTVAGSIYILNNSPLLQVLHIFFHMWFFLMMSLDMQKFLIFILFNVFIICIFCIKRSILKSWQYFIKNFKGLFLIFKSLLDLELIFMYGVR